MLQSFLNFSLSHYNVFIGNTSGFTDFRQIGICSYPDIFSNNIHSFGVEHSILATAINNGQLRRKLLC